ncbi:MAG: hypothetical protein A2176_13420 [Spirochaetes bacterium RBG_13_51_14]|nr:MAG: hypothetical protein A2176_13420 [Spirochaetes bacterium RBG_13_51_14]
MGTRLNKYLAQCGLGSRRRVEELISSGRITLNGKKTSRMGIVVGPEDLVELDGRSISQPDKHVYLILNKPRGYITTMQDDRDRATIMDLIPEKFKRRGVYPVGRLDRDTLGLLLLTNDGDLAYRLTKPDFHIPKEYFVDIDRPLTSFDQNRISRGIYIRQLNIKTRPLQIECVDESCRRIRMMLIEGKKRQIRYTFMNLGYKVKRLERTAYGMLTLKRIKRGSIRVLTAFEIRLLRKQAGL